MSQAEVFLKAVVTLLGVALVVGCLVGLICPPSRDE